MRMPFYGYLFEGQANGLLYLKREGGDRMDEIRDVHMQREWKDKLIERKRESTRQPEAVKQIEEKEETYRII